MKIVYVYGGPVYGTLGGHEYVVRRLAEVLSEKQYKITVLCPSGSNNMVHGNENGVEYVEIPSYSLMNRLRFPKPSWMRLIFQNLQKVDVVHVHCTDNPFAFFLAVFSRLLNKPLVVTVLAYGDDLRHHWKLARIFGLFTTALQTISIWIADEVHVESPYDKHKLSRYRGKIFMIPPGISDFIINGTPSRETMELVECKIDFQSKRKVVLYLGRIHEAKGVIDAVSAISILKSNGYFVKLVLAGPDNNFLKEVERAVNDLGLNQEFVYLGRVSEEQKVALLDLADVLVIPSLSDIVEAFSIVASEAWARKKFVIAYSVGALRYRVKNGENGFLAKMGDVKELAAKIAEAFLCDQNSETPSDVIGWDEVGQQFENLYANILKQE